MKVRTDKAEYMWCFDTETERDWDSDTDKRKGFMSLY